MPRHAFAICAYGKSEYLTECIESVLNQTMPGSEVFVSTSTPSPWLTDIAERYGLPLYVNEGESGIGQDWNFAYSHATAEYVTIAHQDDTYCPGYAERAVQMLDEADDSLIFFSDYGELRQGVHVDDNRLLRIKRTLLHGLANGKNSHNIGARRRAMSIGSSICCPAVTLNRRNCPNPPFVVGMKSNLDWDTWETISRMPGGFYYSTDILMYHRIHEESTTTKLIQSSVRGDEDLLMLERFWPKPVARFLYRFYSKGQASNSLG